MNALYKSDMEIINKRIQEDRGASEPSNDEVDYGQYRLGFIAICLPVLLSIVNYIN